ncbi:MAG: response regulator transcription factor [Christensenellaceae bacterium]
MRPRFYGGAAEQTPDVVLLDIMLPDGNGLEVLKSVERYPSVCCIMLSALGQEGDKVTGLNLGADDYIAKPFGMELVARVKAALCRRAGNNAESRQAGTQQRYHDGYARFAPARAQ